jgi:RES domain-containing protein
LGFNSLMNPAMSAPPPHPESGRLSRAIARCVPLNRRFSGIVYRAASVRRANATDLVAGIGSLLTGGRWTSPGLCRAVYASLDETTALDESRQQNVRQGVQPWMALPLVLTALEVHLTDVLDLTDGPARKRLGVSRNQMLSEPWFTIQNQGQEALTQAIGRLAREQGFVALLVPSVVRASAANIVIFPDRFKATDRLSIINPDGLPL